MQQIRQEKILNIPNTLTLVRIALLPIVAWCFKKGNMAAALGAYLIAMLTDAFDGAIARKTNQITAFGKLLDPVADKLSLVTLLWLFVSDRQIPAWVLFVIIVKELLMVIGSSVALRNGIVVYALPIGKVTTVAFVASMIGRFIGYRLWADGLLYLSVALSIVAFFWYSNDLMRKMGEKKIQNRQTV